MTKELKHNMGIQFLIKNVQLETIPIIILSLKFLIFLRDKECKEILRHFFTE